MANKMSLDDLKKSIRSLLTSTPNALTMDRLNLDYRDFFGMNIPYQQFDYNSLEQFLKSNPDVCVVSGSGKFATITPCISEKTAHINEMVMRQKKSVPKGRRHRPPPPRFQTRSYNQGYNQFNRSSDRPPQFKRPAGYAMSPCTSSNSSMSNTYQQNYAPPAEPKSWAAPKPIGQTNLRNQTNINTNKTDHSKPRTVITPKPLVPLSNNNTQTKTNEVKRNVDTTCKDDGWNINNRKKVDTNNFEKTSTGNDNVSTLSVQEQNRNMLLARKKHLESLIQNQIKCGNVSPSPTKLEPQLSLQSQSVVFSEILPDAGPVLEEDDKYMFTSKNLELFKRGPMRQELDHRLPSFPSDSKPNEQADEEHEVTSNVPAAIQGRLKTLISQYDNGVWCAELPAIYKKLFRRDLRFEEYGYTSLIEMCISLKDIFHYVRPGKDDFKLYDKTKPLPETAEKSYTMASYDLMEQSDDQENPKNEDNLDGGGVAN